MAATRRKNRSLINVVDQRARTSVRVADSEIADVLITDAPMRIAIKIERDPRKQVAKKRAPRKQAREIRIVRRTRIVRIRTPPNNNRSRRTQRRRNKTKPRVVNTSRHVPDVVAADAVADVAARVQYRTGIKSKQRLR